MAVFALLVTSCSSATPSRTVQSPGDSPATTRNPDLGRTITDPATGDVTNAAPSTDPLDTDADRNVVHVLGSVRSTPTDAQAWQVNIPIVESDLATIASVNCNLVDDCDIEAIADWAEGRVDVINLATSANVLSVDELAEFTDLLEARGVAVVGFGTDRNSAERPFVFVNGDLTISIHSVSLEAVPDVQATEDAAGIAGPQSFDAVVEAVMASRDAEQGVVVIVDSGRLEQRAPSPTQTSIVEQLIDAGANAVIGHGPDFLQRFDQIGGGVAAYGLGNSVSASADPLRRDTSILRLEFARPGRSCLLPATASGAGPALDDLSVLSCEG